MSAARTVAIAGGGVVGRTLAVCLASQPGLTVRLLTDAIPKGGPAAAAPSAADARASAIAAGARKLFARIGVWRALAENAEPMRAMSITDSADGDVVRPEVLTFDGEPDGQPFAHMVPNALLAEALRERCAALGIADEPALAFYEEGEQSLALERSDGELLQAAVLVAADGRASRVRAIAGIPVVAKDYAQGAVVGTVRHERAHNGVAVQHFLPNGPLAMLPLAASDEAPHRSSLVWTEGAGFARSLTTMDPALAALEIERAFGLSLGRLSIEGELQSRPIGALLARRLVEGRVALAGDSAHVIHPLAGQGLNLGLRDVATLAETLVGAARLGEDLERALPRYEKRRRADAVQMALVTDGLNAIFSRRSALARAVRSVGLAVVDERDPLKALFMREAAGLEGDVPRLMRGEAL